MCSFTQILEHLQQIYEKNMWCQPLFPKYRWAKLSKSELPGRSIK